MIVLDTIRHAIQVMAKHERQLLPSAHLVWFSLVRVRQAYRDRDRDIGRERQREARGGADRETEREPKERLGEGDGERRIERRTQRPKDGERERE